MKCENCGVYGNRRTYHRSTQSGSFLKLCRSCWHAWKWDRA